jgi:REP element-mobilizing transposase RayT
MARKPRIEYPGAFFHIIVRGNNRETIFREVGDYSRYIEKLAHFCREGDVRVYAYCLMPNHLHLLVEMGMIPLSKTLQRFHISYTAYFNKKYGRVGHIFQGRYKAILCDRNTYLLELVRYIHLNPVRAGLVEQAGDYAWSSHRVYIGVETSHVIDPFFVLRQLSDDPTAARQSYARFVVENPTQSRREDLYKVCDQRILGDENFVRQVSQLRKEEEGKVAVIATMHFRLEELQKIIEKVLPADSGSLKSPGQVGAWMRRIFCHIARTHGDHKGTDVARYLGKNPATVTQGLRVIEHSLSSADQKTINAIKGILETLREHRMSR